MLAVTCRGAIEYQHQCLDVMSGRIGNRVQITDGAATVCVLGEARYDRPLEEFREGGFPCDNVSQETC